MFQKLSFDNTFLRAARNEKNINNLQQEVLSLYDEYVLLTYCCVRCSVFVTDKTWHPNLGMIPLSSD